MRTVLSRKIKFRKSELESRHAAWLQHHKGTINYEEMATSSSASDVLASFWFHKQNMSLSVQWEEHLQKTMNKNPFAIKSRNIISYRKFLVAKKGNKNKISNPRR